MNSKFLHTVTNAANLEAIADDLQALPPKPSLKKQALEILDEVEGSLSHDQAKIMLKALLLIPGS